MAKKIKNPVAVVVTYVSGQPRARADYGVECEHEIEQRRSMEVTLLPTTLNDVYEEAVAQIHANEGTTEVID